MTLSWSVVMFVKERGRRSVTTTSERAGSIECVIRCWTNYNYLKYYYIIDGPRYAVMIVRRTLVGHVYPLLGFVV